MRVTDTTRVPEFLAMLEELGSTKVEVGILGDAGSDILLIASVNEFGASINVTDKMRGYLSSQGIHLRADTTTINIPERSYIREVFDTKKSVIISQCESTLEKVINLQIPPSTLFELIGQLCVSLIQDHMTSLSSPANSPATVRLKGSSNPLINTGRLRSSINFRLVRG